jgi:hypothetical protein
MPLLVPSSMKRHIETTVHQDARRDAEIRAGLARCDSAHGPPQPSSTRFADNKVSSGTTWIRQFIEPDRVSPPRPSLPSVSDNSHPSIFTSTFSASDDIVLESDPYIRNVNMDIDQHLLNGNPLGPRLTSEIREEVMDDIEGTFSIDNYSLLKIILAGVGMYPWSQEEEEENVENSRASIDPRTFPWPDLKVFLNQLIIDN